MCSTHFQIDCDSDEQAEEIRDAADLLIARFASDMQRLADPEEYRLRKLMSTQPKGDEGNDE